MAATPTSGVEKLTATDVLGFYSELAELGIPLWIDGGWCVDGLLGTQTRPHADLDIALDQKHVARAVGVLAEKGYREVKRDSVWNFEMADDAGHRIDFHVFVMDANGNLVDGVQYTESALNGTGTINGEPVRCIAPQFLVNSRTGYEPRLTDLHDVRALCDKFGLAYPPGYR